MTSSKKLKQDWRLFFTAQTNLLSFQGQGDSLISVRQVGGLGGITSLGIFALCSFDSPKPSDILGDMIFCVQVSSYSRSSGNCSRTCC